MTDYIDRQAAIDMFQRMAYDDWNQGVSTTWANAFSECADMVEDIPSADAFEVVRCKDCRNYVCDGVMVCIRFEDASLKPDDYCSYGERKNG